MRGSLLITVVLIMVVTSSCKKEVQESLQSVEDNAQIETEFAQIYEVVSDYAANDPLTGKTEEYLLPSGAVVTFTDTTFTDGDGVDFMIDYGPLNHSGSNKGILCKDGRYRAGVIHAGITAPWSQLPCTLTVAISAANNYYVGNGTKMYKITGAKSVQRTSDTSYTVIVTDATLQRDNNTASWSSTRTVTRTYDAGSGWLNDEYTIVGTASGINANGVSFTVATVTPLLKKLSLGCMSTFVAGELVLTNSNGKTFAVNYDPDNDRACDKKLTVTINGKTYTVTLW